MIREANRLKNSLSGKCYTQLFQVVMTLIEFANEKIIPLRKVE